MRSTGPATMLKVHRAARGWRVSDGHQRLLLPGHERLCRRGVSLIHLVCGGCGTPRSRNAIR